MKRLLIVEDDPAWAAVMERYARDVDAASRVVLSGGQAMELIDEWRPDVLLLDMLLAGETGVALLNELRSHDDLATLPVVVCSSVELDQVQLAPFGVRAVLDKSHVTPTEVRAALRKVLARAARVRGAAVNDCARSYCGGRIMRKRIGYCSC